MSGSNASGWPYNILGLDDLPEHKKIVKRAYARKLKQIDQIAEPEKFQELRQAYEACLAYVEAEYEEEGDDWEEVVSIRPDGPVPDTPIPDISVEQEETVAPSVDHTIDEAPQSSTDIETIGEAEEFHDGTDWALVNQLCEKVWEESSEPLEDRLTKIIADPTFADPDAMRQLEFTIYRYVLSKMSYTKSGEPTFYKHLVSESLLKRLDKEFDWLSDYVGLRQKFGDADDFTLAASDVIGATALFQEPKEKRSWKSFNKKAADIIRHPLTIILSISLSIFCAYIYSQHFPDKGNTAFAIALYGNVFNIFLLMIILAAAYFINWDKVTDILFSFRVWLLWFVSLIGVVLLEPILGEQIYLITFQLFLLFPVAVIIAIVGVYIWAAIMLLVALYAITVLHGKRAFAWIIRRFG